MTIGRKKGWWPPQTNPVEVGLVAKQGYVPTDHNRQNFSRTVFQRIFTRSIFSSPLYDKYYYSSLNEQTRYNQKIRSNFWTFPRERAFKKRCCRTTLSRRQQLWWKMSVFKYPFHVGLLYLSLIANFSVANIENDLSKCEINGPGILPNQIVLPARYFFIKSTEKYFGYSVQVFQK